jgi:hypothetical protein
LLAALEAQTFDEFDVVVVDDGSLDGSRELAERTTVHGRAVQVLDSGGRGAVAARCLGVEATTTPFLAFTDSDCAPEPGWLTAAVDALEAGADLVHGPTEPSRPPRPLERTLWSEREGLYPTCNVLYRRAAFDAAGGFDTGAADRLRFRVNPRAKGLGFGEDTILAWRVQRAGGRATYVPDAKVKHHVFAPDLRESMSRSVMTAAFPGLVREVPELRHTLLRRGVFLGEPVRTPLYIALGALALRKRGVAASASAIWAVGEWRLLQRSHGGPLADRVRAFPVRLVLGAVTAAALLVGDVRHRRVVL